MTKAVINPRIRGFICTTSHPEGCAANVQRMVNVAAKAGPGKGLGNVLVVGASGGYGLASTITALFGHGANVLGVAFERPGQGDRAGSGGWYNLAEVQKLAKASGKRSINPVAWANILASASETPVLRSCVLSFLRSA